VSPPFKIRKNNVFLCERVFFSIIEIEIRSIMMWNYVEDEMQQT
jgi:hypothetical protein